MKKNHLKIYNTLTNQLEAFVPTNPQEISFYSCGPTVYDDAHIGNFRSFLAADLLRRWLESPLCTLINDPDSPQQPPRTVVHVMNITDVGHMTDDSNADGGGEDKMELAARRIEQAKKSGTIPQDSGVDPSNPREVAAYYEARFKQDAIALGLKVAIEAQSDPSLMPKASEHIQGMKTVIEQLLNDNHAYPAGSPGSRAIYFNTASFPTYGRLSGNTLDQLKGGAGGRVDDAQQSEKHNPADFLLWKEDKTHKMRWPSPTIPGLNDDEQWGEGYPGWHIECTAMALDRLVEGHLEGARTNHAQIDLHSGGEDNIFPHHECEIAQSCCFTGNDSFAKHWFHPRFLKVEGQKMSKSKGTMYTLRDLTKLKYDSATIRLELIKTHYRANADFSEQGLKESALRIKRWREMARRLQYAVEHDPHLIQYGALDSISEKIASAMSNDLNISAVLGAIDSASKKHSGKGELDIDHIYQSTKLAESPYGWNRINELLGSNIASHRQLGVLHRIDHILGVIFRPIPKSQDTGIALYQPGVTPSPEIESLLQQRADAKKAKDFAAADAIRDQLTAMGLSIMDKPKGQVEVAPIN